MHEVSVHKITMFTASELTKSGVHCIKFAKYSKKLHIKKLCKFLISNLSENGNKNKI